MSSALLRTGRCLSLAALFFVLGGHWAVMQTVAWGLMLADYAHETTTTEALEKTFDGQHPCAICKKVESGKQSEKKSEVVVAIKKVEVYYEATAHFVPAFRASWSLSSLISRAGVRSEQPAVPPPRLALA